MTVKQVQRLIKTGKLHLYKHELIGDYAEQMGLKYVYFVWDPNVQNYRGYNGSTVEKAIARFAVDGPHVRADNIRSSNSTRII